MSWILTRDRRAAARLAAVGAYRFPAGARHLFSVEHADLGPAAIALVEDAARQWFRLTARHPRAALSTPSVVVGDLWRETVRDTRGYAEFCEAAFGHLLPYSPGHAGPGLAATFRLACADESCGPGRLPLLFRVDKALAVPGGHHYLADCGGRSQCYESPGSICLQHVAGVEKPKRRWPGQFGSAPTEPGAGSADIGGCGFGP